MICDHCRNIEELKKLYTQRPMAQQYDFDFLLNNPNLFCFYSEGINEDLKGYITVQREGKYLTLSGASVRKNMSDNIDAIVKVCEAFKENMYSFTRSKPARICLLKAGFKHIKDDMYIRKRFTNG